MLFEKFDKNDKCPYLRRYPRKTKAKQFFLLEIGVFKLKKHPTKQLLFEYNHIEYNHNLKVQYNDNHCT